MKSLSRTLGISSMLVLLAPFASAQAAATLNCTDEGGFPPVVTPLYAFNVNTDLSSGVFDATVFINISLFPTFLSTESGYYSNCTISTKDLSISMNFASVVDVSATGGVGGIPGSGSHYTSVILVFPSVTVNGITKSLNTDMTAEAIAKAVAASHSQNLVVSKDIGER